MLQNNTSLTQSQQNSALFVSQRLDSLQGCSILLQGDAASCYLVCFTICTMLYPSNSARDSLFKKRLLIWTNNRCDFGESNCLWMEALLIAVNDPVCISLLSLLNVTKNLNLFKYGFILEMSVDLHNVSASLWFMLIR